MGEGGDLLREEMQEICFVSLPNFMPCLTFLSPLFIYTYISVAREKRKAEGIDVYCI
jgi:hypothetical protein